MTSTQEAPDCPNDYGPYQCYLADTAYAHRNGWHKAPAPKGASQKKWPVTPFDHRRWEAAAGSKVNPLADVLAKSVADMCEGMLPEVTLRAAIASLSVHHPVYDQLITDMDFSPSFMMLEWDAAARLAHERLTKVW